MTPGSSSHSEETLLFSFPWGSVTSHAAGMGSAFWINPMTVSEEKGRCYSLKMQEFRLPQLTPFPGKPAAHSCSPEHRGTLYLQEDSPGNLFVGSGSHQNAAYLWSLFKLKQNLNIMQGNSSSMGKQALRWTAHQGALLWRKKLQFSINKSCFSHFPF